MNKIFLFFFFLTTNLFAQNTFTVYFDTNSSNLSKNELSKLDDFFRNKKVVFTKVVGFCDYRASNSYNDSLSLKRANFVKNILEKTSNQKDILEEGKGENFLQDKALRKNRKVEIFYEEKSDLAKNISLGKVGDKLIVNNLYFYNHSGEFVPDSYPVLKELLKIMQENPKLKIEIHGHICCQSIEDASKIIDIGLVRAKAVYDYLVQNDIDKSRLKFKSFKSSQPIFPIPEKNEDERNANRRVEIQILEN